MFNSEVLVGLKSLIDNDEIVGDYFEGLSVEI
jgi:hypothetical protein